MTEKKPAKFTILPLSMMNKGEFTVAGSIKATLAENRKRIHCVPTPCRGGWHYCPDWYGLTEFG